MQPALLSVFLSHAAVVWPPLPAPIMAIGLFVMLLYLLMKDEFRISH